MENRAKSILIFMLIGGTLLLSPITMPPKNPKSLVESNELGKSIPSIKHIPKVKQDQNGFFYSEKTSNQHSEGDAINSFGRSFQISASIPSLWTRTENFNVQFTVYLSGYIYADVTLVFEGYDNCPGPSEIREVYKTKSVRASGYSSVNTLSCYLPSTATVGLKRAQVSVSGKAYYYDGVTPDSIEPDGLRTAPGTLRYDSVYRSQTWGYEFISRYGLSDLQTYGGLPPNDDMSSLSQNPNYYWEGNSGDGFGIPITRALFRPTEWPIIYQAAYLVDNCISYPEYSSEVLTSAVNSLITYYMNSDTHETTNADMFTYNYNWRGVCDEFAVVMCSFLRVLNIPCRFMIGYDGNWLGGTFSHAWCETYVSGTWIHCDATMDLFNAPWYYSANYLVTFDWLRIYSCGDDGKGDWGPYDGNTVNGKLHYHLDWYYFADYDGPNNY